MDIKKIEDATKRQVTFSKRRSGLIKKINDTAICCDIDAAFVTFSSTGRLSKFCSRNRIEDVLQRYLTLPPEEKHRSNSNIDHVEEKVKQLRHLSDIKGDENKLHYLNNKLKHKELQVKKSKIDLEITEAELRNYEPDPTQDPSLAELEWCENHLKISLRRMVDRKRKLLNNFPSSLSETPRFQREIKNRQQSFHCENDYEKKLYSETNHQTSDHNLGQRDSWINRSGHSNFGRAPQPQYGVPQDLQGKESIVSKSASVSFMSFPSVQESSVGALIPQVQAQGPHSDAPTFNVQLQGGRRDALVPIGIVGQTNKSVPKNSMEQTLGIPTCHLPVNVDNLFWQDGPQSSATDNMDCNALLENGSYPSFVNGNNNGHHAALYQGNPSPDKSEDLYLLNEPTSENNSIEQTFGIPTSHVPANVDNLFLQNGRNFSTNDNLDFTSLLDTERNVYPSFVDGNNDGHHAALYNGKPSPKKQEDLYLLNEPTAQGNMAPDNLLSTQENPEDCCRDWDGYALAKLLNSEKFETMF